MRPCPL